MAAQKFLRSALVSEKKKDFSGENSFADLGLERMDSFVKAETIGREQRLPRRIDDSVAAVVDARKAEKNGQIEYAASIKVGVLDERINTYGHGVLCK